MSDCVGCGFCCMKATCVIGFFHFNETELVCPSLIWSVESNRYLCQLALDEPEKIGKELYIGAGCCMGLNSWRRNVRLRESVSDNDPT